MKEATGHHTKQKPQMNEITCHVKETRNECKRLQNLQGKSMRSFTAFITLSFPYQLVGLLSISWFHSFLTFTTR